MGYPRDFEPEPDHDPAAPGRRVLLPGGGWRLMERYRQLRILSAGAVLIAAAFPLFVLVEGVGRPQRVTLLAAVAVIGAGAFCLFRSLRWGLGAVHEGYLDLSEIAVAWAWARRGGLIGWVGGPVVALLGVVQQMQSTPHALLWGLMLGAAGVLPAAANDSARHLTKPFT